MKKNYVSLCLFCITGLSGQIGINTSNPQASLDIVAQSNATAKGLLVPRLTSAEIFAMTTQNKLGSEQHSLIVFATDTPSHSDFVISKITQPGFYRYTYNGADPIQQYWRKMEPTAFERIIQNGKSGIRLIDANPQNYANIGNNAVDASFSNQIIAGGNGASGDYSFASGLNNVASGAGSLVMGEQNTSYGSHSFSGGLKSRAIGENSMAMGDEVDAVGNNTIAFGKTNSVSWADNSSILAGRNNRVSNSLNSVILSGHNNTVNLTGSADDNFSSPNYNGISNNILGGYNNTISGTLIQHHTIVGGTYNIMNQGRYSVISGGSGNKIRPISAPYNADYFDSNVIAGGESNEINADRSVISGGANNSIKIQGYRIFGGGVGFGVIAGGQNNTIDDAHYSFVLGGKYNKTKGSYSIVGGASNTAQSVGEISLGIFGTLYTAQYINGYTHNGTWNIDFNESKDRLFNLGNGKTINMGNLGEYAQRSDAFTVLKNGQVGIDIDNFETNTTSAKLQVNGGIKMGAQSATLSGNTCDNNNRGQIIFVEDNFYGCKSTGWVLLNN